MLQPEGTLSYFPVQKWLNATWKPSFCNAFMHSGCDRITWLISLQTPPAAPE